MVAGCPKCSARYRVDADRIGPDGAKLRCTKCSAVFLVRAPRAAAEAPVAAPPVAAAPPSEAVDPTRLVIIADSDDARGKSTAEAVRSWGLSPHVVPDGVEAMLAIQRMLPAAVVLDAALPKMFGFQVCEVVKRNESLRDTIVVLVGAIHKHDRYRRAPEELYGADVYIEAPDLPDGLHPILAEGGLPLTGPEAAPAPVAAPPVAAAPSPVAPVASAPEPSFEAPVPDPVFEAPAPEAPAPPAPAPAAGEMELELSLDEPVAPPQTEPEWEFASDPAAVDPAASEPASSAAPQPDEDPERAEERERAERLARIAVSEMLLYQPEKFEEAARAGNLEQVLDLEIQEARALLRQRIREDVREETDFVLDELNRVAAERSAQG